MIWTIALLEKLHEDGFLILNRLLIAHCKTHNSRLIRLVFIVEMWKCHSLTFFKHFKVKAIIESLKITIINKCLAASLGSSFQCHLTTYYMFSITREKGSNRYSLNKRNNLIISYITRKMSF